MIFPVGDASLRNEMKALIAKNEAKLAKKPLTPELFRVTADGFQPFHDA